MALKPQDVYVTLKIVADKSRRAPYFQLAAELVMSPSEVHASVKRAERARLLHGPKLHNRSNFAALEEFLIHGLKYVFAAERGEITRGVPTAYAAEPLRIVISAWSARIEPDSEPVLTDGIFACLNADSSCISNASTQPLRRFNP